MQSFNPTHLAVGVFALLLLALPHRVVALSDAQALEVQRKLVPDLSGAARQGKASYYHHSLAGRKMADGTPMDPSSNVAASKTLPLGTVARVTNLENGRSAVVQIRDRGPYVEDRIVDLSPSTAQVLGMQEQGIAAVEVKPLSLPAALRSAQRD
jgi:rare lipoprotein A